MTDSEIKELREDLMRQQVEALEGITRLRKLQATASPAELKRLRDETPNYSEMFEEVTARLISLDAEGGTE